MFRRLRLTTTMAIRSVAEVFFLLIIGGRWIVFADGSSGGTARNGYSGGLWSSVVAPSNVGLAVSVTVMAGLTVAFTFVYSRRKEYENLRRQCREIHKRNENGCDAKQIAQSNNTEDSQVLDSHDIAEVNSSKRSIQVEESEKLNSILQDGDCEESGVTSEDAANDSVSTNSEETESSPLLAKEETESHNTVSSDSTKSEETETSPFLAKDEAESHDTVNSEETETSPLVAKKEAESQEKGYLTPASKPKMQAEEEFTTTWQRIIGLDAVRANDEWVLYSPSQAVVSDKIARGIATHVGLNDYEHLEPCRIFHAARLVGILEAYAVYDPEIGYCQGMSDLLSPLIAIIEDDVLAFWCFVGFMSKACHNFRLDEVGIRRQLSMVSKIIKFKDIRLYMHLEN
ncbi:hypothetical protein N665_0412s0011 [Sinapis alba]|nr:hypothetical protein N665_0412s0011 [Sinapis alba]